ncbi:tetratricopeptide (TPR) repeat protein [Lysobacter niastensis]|uniref:Tetratricopeptide (TPR) repeat protein n=1 Tax=Lysobacter niastensis TaxID=380629 RepID=A0ABU1WCB0_9GAMM|nr:tetratricopeptide repeat protein [Lysobacter niastensis]MDR7135106.1 tetratricopeptide (TPR) repeat protein [Lysobacter niastensis]
MPPSARIAPYVAACLLLALIAWAYWPGLSGPFLFDDFGNLDVLGRFGRLDRWPELGYYLTSGRADPIGRPLSLLTFLLDARTWPADPWPFKRTNLILHLINTALLVWTVARLQAGMQRRDPAFRASAWTPVVAAALWAAHPFLVSTTLYVVQRQAMLPATFVMLALLAWDRAVLAFEGGRARAGWCWSILGFGGAAALATLSKANGLLAPLLVGVAYLCCLRAPSTTPKRADAAAWLCLALPTALLATWIAWLAWPLWSQAQIHGRDWSLAQRLLSEPRAFWDYVTHLVLPRAGGGGVFVEDFPVSRDWWHPATTLPALLALLGSAVAAIAWRDRVPVLAYAWLFFLCGHLLEGTVVPLELYFEHRNYLPALFLGWPVAHALLRPGGYPRYRASLAVLLLVALLLVTHQRAQAWGDHALLGALSARYEAGSARSQADAANAEVSRGAATAGRVRILAAQRAHPESVDLAINAIGIECATTGALAADTLARARTTLATVAIWNYNLYDWLQAAARDHALRACRGFGMDGLSVLLDAAERNPRSAAPLRRRDLWHVRGQLALANNQPQEALRWFDAVLDLTHDPEYALVQAAALGNVGEPQLAQQHLDRYERLHAAQPGTAVRDAASLHNWLLEHYGYYRREFSLMRHQLASDTASRQ